MRDAHRIVAALVVPILLHGFVGCSARPQHAIEFQLALIPAAQNYNRGDIIRVLLANGGSDPVFRKTCGLTLQRETSSDEWVTVVESPCGTESAVWRAVDPGETGHVDVPTHARFEAGRYRAVLPIQYSRDRESERSVISLPFRLHE
jgi:hypothetical protein